MTFYTPDEPYPTDYRRLAESCQAFEIPLVGERIESTGSWSRNCAIKADFCLEMVQAHGWIMWLDADAEIRRRPPFDVVAEFDFGIYTHPRHEFQSGTLLIHDSSQTRSLIRAWRDRCHAQPTIWDQKHLYDAYWLDLGTSHHPNTAHLHQGWCKVFDQPWHDGEWPEYVRHHQASRRARKKGLPR